MESVQVSAVFRYSIIILTIRKTCPGHHVNDKHLSSLRADPRRVFLRSLSLWQVLFQHGNPEDKDEVFTMSYRRELEKYRDLDEDEILGALTEDELRTLENELDELDPDVSRLEGTTLSQAQGQPP